MRPEVVISPWSFGFCGAALWHLLGLGHLKILFWLPNSYMELHVSEGRERALVLHLMNKTEQGGQVFPQLGQDMEARRGLGWMWLRTPRSFPEDPSLLRKWM